MTSRNYTERVIPKIDPLTLRKELDGPTPPTVIDVREPDELQISRLPDEIRNIPLADLPDQLATLSADENYVLVCRVGGRSGQATAYLAGQGFRRVRNLTGGMNAYAREVDPTLPVY